MKLSAYIMMLFSREIIPITFYIALVGFILSAGCTNPEQQSNKNLIP